MSERTSCNYCIRHRLEQIHGPDNIRTRPRTVREAEAEGAVFSGSQGVTLERREGVGQEWVEIGWFMEETTHCVC